MEAGGEHEVGWKADLAAKVLAAVSAVSFSVFLLALMAVTDPVAAALLGHFQPLTCVVSETSRLSNASACLGWSSCKNLCADPPVLYSCVHLLVHVYNASSDVNGTLTPDADEEAASARFELMGVNVWERVLEWVSNHTQRRPQPSRTLLPQRPVRFFVNAAGCGYSLNCTDFQQRFGQVGQTVPCLYSHVLNRTVPIDVPSLHDHLVFSIVAAAVPAAISIFSLAYLCIKGHCSMPRMTPRHIVVRSIKRKKLQVRRQIRVMQKRGSIRSVRSVRSSGPPTPQSVDWKKQPLPNITVQRMENDLVVQAV